MKLEDITQFGYEIQGDDVVIHCHFQGQIIKTNGIVPFEEVAFSWSVPKSEIESMEDPTDYLKQAIVNANQ
jgi:hypothetical protein